MMLPLESPVVSRSPSRKGHKELTAESFRKTLTGSFPGRRLKEKTTTKKKKKKEMNRTLFKTLQMIR
jgi:hypothetical protein